MDWKRAIERNSEALGAIVLGIAAMLEAAGGARITKAYYRAVLRVLHPAEAAVRRLIVIVARGLEARPVPSRPAPLLPIKRGSPRRLAFRLFDTRKRFALGPEPHGPRLAPRIHFFASDPRVAALWSAPQPVVPPSPADDGLVDSRRLVMRFQALKLALGDLPRQARRLARLRAKRRHRAQFKTISPLRPGPPPGSRKRRTLDIDFVLAECHGLAHDALQPDTS